MNCIPVQPAIEQDVWALRGASARIYGVIGRVWRAHRSMLVIAAEMSIAALSYGAAVFIFAAEHPAGWAITALKSTVLALLVARTAALVGARLYRSSLRYSSISDFILIVKIVALSSLLFVTLAWRAFAAQQIPVAVIVVDGAFLMIGLLGMHFGMRILMTQQAAGRREGKRVLVIGAGDAGMALVKELAMDPRSPWIPVGVVDDNPEKWGRSIYGVRILSNVETLKKIAAELRADEILICVPSASAVQMKHILSACRKAEIPVRTLPSLSELMDGHVSRRDLRSPRIEDLLQREPILVDVDETRRIVGGKVVLVTGAGGSIGSELCRQIAQAGPKKLLLLDKSENSLFYIHREVSETVGTARCKPFLVDLVYRERVREILREERPEIIFHAAAHKHVALLELHPQEAIRNNVLGTRNVAEAAQEFGVARFVNISTDKAVSPKSFLGISKRLTELCIRELAESGGTRFSNVRFGNVAGSTGSVVRLFWEKIQKGEAIRVTDPRATRYFMSVPEAVHLILRAATLGHGGETFVFDMGEPVNIYELAKTMILFAGLKPERDVAIEFTGLGRGEKITEDLWDSRETPSATEHSRIWQIAEHQAGATTILHQITVMEAHLQIGDREGLLEYMESEIAPLLRCDPSAAASAFSRIAPWPGMSAGTGTHALASREVA